AGGHSRRIAEKLGPDGLLIAIDRDSEARRRYDDIEGELPCQSRFIEAPFAEALAQLGEEQIPVDMVWFDLGVSSMQIDTPERGFSYSADAPLDMRMDPSVGVTAAEIVAEWDERRLARTFREYGEERYSDRIARAIVRERERRPIETTTELVDIVTAAIPTPARFGAGHPAKRVFQALRIAVNDELDQIDRALPLAWELLRENGRFAGISFQSLEDRRVKQFLAGLARECVCPPGLPICRCGHVSEAKLLTRGGITPTEAETDENPRARSARMRAALKIAGATQ
ncbi:MAG: 16S rRNA (cytosine(1402)-N(4))-methyltransferase RsmH, partial [Actinobacteria bacterium]|nr:16S rRNA (cytosine(1402)-N(4))-methyltransferase RsmH [Actinomycetota bacterium]